MILRITPIINIVIAAIVTLTLCIALGVGFSFIASNFALSGWKGVVSPYPLIATLGIIFFMLMFVAAHHRAVSIKAKQKTRPMTYPYCLSRDEFANVVDDICQAYSETQRAYYTCFMLCEIEATIPPNMPELQFQLDIATDDYGALLRRILRDTDCVGQISPNIFGILLLDTTRIQAESAARRILEVLDKSSVSENVSSAISNFKIKGIMADQPRFYHEFIDSLTQSDSPDKSGLLMLSLPNYSKVGESNECKTQKKFIQNMS